MAIRKMTVEERIHGTLNGATEYHCQYHVQNGDDQHHAEFTLAAVIAASAVVQATWDAVIAAIQAYGDVACGGYIANSARFLRVEEHPNPNGPGYVYLCLYRLVPAGAPPEVADFELSAVQAANPGITAQQWSNVIGALKAYGDAASGYVP